MIVNKKKIIKCILLMFIFLNLPFCLFAQEKFDIEKLGPLPKMYADTIETTHNYFFDKGYKVYRAATLNMNKNTEFPVYIDLYKGKLYHFLIYADIESEKVIMKMGKEGWGDIITYKFRPSQNGEIFTEFSYICPENGRYLFLLYQRGPKKKPFAHISILQKVTGDSNVQFGH